MGLAINVGVLAEALADDHTDVIEWFEGDLEIVNRVLAAQGLPAHVEPRKLPPAARPRAGLMGFPYVTLHFLRRAYAHRCADPSWIATPFPKAADPADDPRVEEQTERFESHLLCHGDAAGWYVPIDFHEIVMSDEDDDLPGGLLGSSCRLIEELRVVAPALGIRLVDGALSDAEAARVDAIVRAADSPLWAEHAAWLALFEAARLSVEFGVSVEFS